MVRINCVFRDGSFKEARRLLLLLFFIEFEKFHRYFCLFAIWCMVDRLKLFQKHWRLQFSLNIRQVSFNFKLHYYYYLFSLYNILRRLYFLDSIVATNTRHRFIHGQVYWREQASPYTQSPQTGCKIIFTGGGEKGSIRLNTLIIN